MKRLIILLIILYQKKIPVKEVIKSFRYDIVINNIIIAIILCENRNDFIFLIFDVKRYLTDCCCEYEIFGYYNVYKRSERRKCLNHIKKEINKYKKIVK